MIETLSGHEDFKGVLRLVAAHACNHVPWVPEALTQILSTPFLGNSLTPGHVRGIRFAFGAGFLEDLLSHHAQIQRIRYRFAFPPDFVWDSMCDDMNRCMAGVEQGWKELVQGPLTSGQNWPVITPDQLRESFTNAGVCHLCAHATLDGIHHRFFESETVAIRQAVQSLVERWFTGH